MSLLHVFPDVQAMAHHLEEASEWAKPGYELIQPQCYEIYRKPSAGASEVMKRTVAQAGAELIISAETLDGYLLLEGGMILKSETGEVEE